MTGEDERGWCKHGLARLASIITGITASVVAPTATRMFLQSDLCVEPLKTKSVRGAL